MKLRYSPTSPYVRKVMVVALETRVAGQIEQVRTDPWSPDDDLPSHNPLGKVPALMLDDGQVLYDSRVIAEYLDELHGGTKVFPPPGEERWLALRQQALADGIMDAAILRLIEFQRRPANLRWQAWVDRQSDKIDRALDLLEEEALLLDGPVTIGTISVAVALEYLDFRFRDKKWRDGRARLTAWHDDFTQRPSMTATRPKLAA